MIETKWSWDRWRGSILDHFPNIWICYKCWIQSKGPLPFLHYTAIHVLCLWMWVLRCIEDACSRTYHDRDEMKLRSMTSSILDHFPNIWISYTCCFRSKDRCVLCHYTAIHMFYVYECEFGGVLKMPAHAFVMIETKWSWGRCRGSILDHFPNVGVWLWQALSIQGTIDIPSLNTSSTSLIIHSIDTLFQTAS